MSKTVYLGIDAGTTKLKAALVSVEGELLAEASRSVTVLRPFEGACEIDMNLLWGQLCEVMQELRQNCPDHWDAIAGLGISGQGDGMWPVDADGSPVRNAILWNDTRTKELTLNNEEEIAQFLIEHHVTSLYAGAFPVILRWLKEKEPQHYGRISKVLHCKDWLNYNLTGVYATDYSDASTAAIEIFKKEYVPELFDMLEIPEAKTMLPTLLPTTAVVGLVNVAASAATGIPQGVPVIAGAIDVAAVALGAGVTKTGEGCTILGTTLCNEILIDSQQVDSNDTNGSALCSIVPGKYVRVMAANSGNAAIDWAKKAMASELSFQELEDVLATLPAGSGGVLFHPYLYGERAPFKDPFACGGFYGLTARHDRFHMLRAVYEGMVLSLMDCYKHLPATDGNIYLSGGGAVSDFTCSLVAHALNRQVLRPQRKELGIYGIVTAVRMALSDSQEIPEFSGSQYTEFHPDEATHRVMEEQLVRFLRLREQMSGFWKERSRTE